MTGQHINKSSITNLFLILVILRNEGSADYPLPACMTDSKVRRSFVPQDDSFIFRFCSSFIISRKVIAVNNFFVYIVFLALSLFSIGCSSNQPKVSNIKITLSPDKRILKITGLDPLIVQDINRDSSGGNWQSLVPVYKMPADTDLKNYQPTQPGKYAVKDSVVTFTPDTPFIAEQTYFVRYYKYDANSKATDFILGHNKLGSLHYTDLIFKQ